MEISPVARVMALALTFVLAIGAAPTPLLSPHVECAATSLPLPPAKPTGGQLDVDYPIHVPGSNASDAYKDALTNGNQLYQASDPIGAQKAYIMALQAAPADPGSDDHTIASLLKLGYLFAASNDWSHARAAWTIAAKGQAAPAEPTEQIVSAVKRSGDMRSLFTLLKLRIDKDVPHDSSSYTVGREDIERALSYAEQGAYDRASSVLQTVCNPWLFHYSQFVLALTQVAERQPRTEIVPNLVHSSVTVLYHTRSAVGIDGLSIVQASLLVWATDSYSGAHQNNALPKI